MARKLAAFVRTLIAGLFAGLPGGAVAEDPTVRFMDHDLAPGPPMLLARKSGNVRGAPSLRGPKIGAIEQGERLRSPGRVPDSPWYALRRDGEDLGFAHDMLLVPVIDGSLDHDLDGHLTWRGATCRYRVAFVGRTMAMEAPIPTTDYDVLLKCRRDDRTVHVQGFMFLTESPFDGGHAPRFQISLDLLNVNDLESPPSVVMIWNQAAGELTVDSVTPEDHTAMPEPSRRAAPRVATALSAAVELASTAWTETLWRDLLAHAP